MPQKKNVRKIFTISMLFLIGVTTLCGCMDTKEEKETETRDAVTAYYEAIDIAYSLNVADSLSSFGVRPDFGFRVSGSPAEIAASSYLYEQMVEIGLQNVRKEPLLADCWEFSTAQLTYLDRAGHERNAILAPFAIECTAEDEEAGLIYAGRGTAKNFDALEMDGKAEGKIVLIEMDPQDWWINWPSYQAGLEGARAVVVMYMGGYGQFSDDTLVVQDFRGPADVPVFSITKKEGMYLKSLAQEAEDGVLSVRMTADSQIHRDEESFAVMGEIPGTSQEVLYVAGHYDGYFHAFDDNASGIGAMLGMAKALIESGYVPEKTIRFIAHPGGEWGLSDSRYDTAIGAYQILENHPDWIEDAFALIQMDGGVTSNFAAGVEVKASWELGLFALDTGMDVEKNPFIDFTVTAPILPRDEAFPYARQGIPVISAGYAGMETQVEEVWRTNMDTKDYFYDEEAFYYSHKLYGTYLIKLDEAKIKPLDAIAYYEALQEKMDGATSENATELADAVAEAISLAKDLNAEIDQLDPEKDAASFNRSLGKIFRYGQDRLMALDWNDQLSFAHERVQHNIDALEGAVIALRSGNGLSAMDDYLCKIDLNWAARAFDKEVVRYFTDQVLGPDARNAWGEGYITDCMDLYDMVQSIEMKTESDEVIDYLEEIKALEQEILDQQKKLDTILARMTKDVVSMNRMMERIVN